MSDDVDPSGVRTDPLLRVESQSEFTGSRLILSRKSASPGAQWSSSGTRRKNGVETDWVGWGRGIQNSPFKPLAPPTATVMRSLPMGIQKD